MSEAEAEELTRQYELKDAKHARKEFLARMERKLRRKERQVRF